jgi:hypothetical protein
MSIHIIGEEKRDVPAWIERELLKIGGRSQDGEPLFRCVWGANRWTLAPDGVTMVHPYRVDLWHLEKRVNGVWEHCYRLGQCPHMTPTDKEWCRACWLSGGEYLNIETEFRAVERCVHLIIKACEMQDKTAQKNALVAREQAKKDQQDIELREMVDNAAMKHVKRSFETPMRITADQTALGSELGFRQVK